MPMSLPTMFTLSTEQRRKSHCRAKPRARIVGRADDGRSLECLVVEIDGSSDRPDGSTYHITWSLGADRKARESNDVLRDKGWQPWTRSTSRSIRARF